MRRTTIVAIVVLTWIAASAVTAVAVDFTDTGSSPFATEIDNITDAGCASGFPDNTFRPQDNVKRQQFAYWMDNCGSRSAEDDNTGAAGTGIGGMPSGFIESASMDIGGAPDQTQYVIAVGNLAVSGPATGGVTCPCQVNVDISLENLANMQIVPGGGTATMVVPAGSFAETATVFARFPVTTEGSYRARLNGFVSTVTSGGCAATCLTVQRADVVMWTTPFNETGGAGSPP